MLEHKLRELLAGQRFFRFGDDGARRVTSHSTKKNHQWNRNERWRRWPNGCNKPNFWDVNISFLLGQPQNSGNAKEEGLDVTLEDLAVQYTQMGPTGWLDVSAWFIKAVNYVLDRLDFEMR